MKILCSLIIPRISGNGIASFAPIFFLLLWCVGGVFFSSCTPREKSAYQTPSHQLVMAIASAPKTLDPREPMSPEVTQIAHLVHRGLLRLSERMEFVPDLAERYEIIVSPQSNDGEKTRSSLLGYRFYLKKGVRFHGGQVFDAQDVIYTLESIQKGSIISPYEAVMRKIDRMVLPFPENPYVLEIYLKESFSPFVSAMTMGILSAKDPRPENGLGPFSLAEWKPQEQILLKKSSQNPEFQSKMDEVLFRVIPDENNRVSALKMGRVDFLQNNIPHHSLEMLKRVDGLVFARTRGVNTDYLGFNTRTGPLAKKEVRQAIAMSLDIPVIMDYRLLGLGVKAEHLLSPIHWIHQKGDDSPNESLPAYPYDPEKAKKLLDQAGYKDPDGVGPQKRFALQFKTATPATLSLARQLARYFEEVGIETKVVPVEWDRFLQDVNRGAFDVFSLAGTGFTDPDIYYYRFHSTEHPPAGGNREGYRSSQVDYLTTEGRLLATREERRPVYRQVEEILLQDLPVLPLWHEDVFSFYRKNVRGVTLKPDSSLDWIVNAWKDPVVKSDQP